MEVAKHARKSFGFPQPSYTVQRDTHKARRPAERRLPSLLLTSASEAPGRSRLKSFVQLQDRIVPIRRVSSSDGPGDSMGQGGDVPANDAGASAPP